MASRDADSKPQDRYEEWYPLLRRELQTVAKPDAQVIAIGSQARCFLSGKILPRPYIGAIRHYGGAGAGHFDKAIKGKEPCYREFSKSVTFEDIQSTAQDVLREAKMESFKDKTLQRLCRGKRLTESRKKLMFDYMVAFEAIRKANTSG